MPKFTYSIDIAKPVETVFHYLDDADYAKQWLGGLESIEALTAGGNRVGAKARHLYKENGREIEMIEETLIYEPNQRVKIAGTTAAFNLTAEYRLSPVSAGTRIDYETELHMKGLVMRLLSPFIMRMSKHKIADDFARLEALIMATE